MASTARYSNLCKWRAQRALFWLTVNQLSSSSDAHFSIVWNFINEIASNFKNHCFRLHLWKFHLMFYVIKNQYFVYQTRWIYYFSLVYFKGDFFVAIISCFHFLYAHYVNNISSHNDVKLLTGLISNADVVCQIMCFLWRDDLFVKKTIIVSWIIIINSCNYQSFLCSGNLQIKKTTQYI